MDKMKEAWQEQYEKITHKNGERPNVKFEPLYFNGSMDESIGFPGVYPYTRGVYPNMYRGRFWTMRQYAGFSSAKLTNERFRYLLNKGQTGLSVAFDLPTQLGLDSDDPLSLGEVGKVGVAIDSLEDMEILLDQIPLDKVSTSMTINSTAMILLAMYMVVAQKQGVSSEKISGTIQNDILKEYIARGTYVLPPGPSVKIINDIFEYCRDNLPKFNTISISGYHIREAGATAVQEVALTFANAIEYLDNAKKVGIDIDKIAPRISFFFNCHLNFFEEIAKFRAARRLWAKIMRERYAVQNPKSMMLRFHTQTAGSTLTQQKPHYNIVRVALQALAAVLGGTQSLHTNSMDEALSLPSQEAVEIALATQQIIAYETHAADTVDPLGGSYFIEQLTDELEEKIKKVIENIEKVGGAVKAIELGIPQELIEESSYKEQLALENHEKIVVGLNKFATGEEIKISREKYQDATGEQLEKLKEIKARRDNQKVKLALMNLKKGCLNNENLFPYVLAAVREYCTIGEITNVWKEVYGEYHP